MPFPGHDLRRQIVRRAAQGPGPAGQEQQEINKKSTRNQQEINNKLTRNQQIGHQSKTAHCPNPTSISPQPASIATTTITQVCTSSPPAADVLGETEIGDLEVACGK
jgi:hypothetical protein